MRRYVEISLLVAAALAVISCGKTSSVASTAISPTFTAIQQQILVPKCVSCHSTSRPRGGVSYSSYAETMASAGNVTPFQPRQSQLYATCFSGEMPRGEGGKGASAQSVAKLTSDELQALFAWIALGALNN